MQNLKRNWLVFKKWHKDFGEFWPNTRKSQNLDFNGLLLIKVYSFWGKKVHRRSLYWIIILNVDASFEGKIKCHFINDMKNLVSFIGALENLKICTFRNFFSPRYKMLRQKNSDELCIMALKGDAMFKEKLTGGLKNDIRNLVNFYGSNPK